MTTDGRYVIERLQCRPEKAVGGSARTDSTPDRRQPPRKTIARQRSRSADDLEKTDIDDYIRALSSGDEDVRQAILERAEVYVRSAIEMGDSQTLASIYEFANVTVLDGEGNTPLHCAAQHDKLRILT